MERGLEQSEKKEELRKKLIGLLNDYSEEPVDLSREERKQLESEPNLLKKYGKSKFRRTWLTLVLGQFQIAESLEIDPSFFEEKAKEMESFLPSFSGTHKDLEKDMLNAKTLKTTNEFDISQEIIDRTNQILKEAIEKLSQ